MRKITAEITASFLSKQRRTIGNTHTDGQALFLHGNKIAEWRNSDLWVTNAGWFSSTTKGRLNGLPNVSVHQKQGVWYLNNLPWDGGWCRP